MNRRDKVIHHIDRFHMRLSDWMFGTPQDEGTSMEEPEPTPKLQASISSGRIYQALKMMGIDPYGVVDVHIGTEFVTVSRSGPNADGTPIVTDYPIRRTGLG
ncbi:hypothetical protein [Gordonia tangerina]|uniref:Uncharacterized protein n=1 Tax=Gordonia tangerina TaxID=2911060 RepID=A0ABS9DL09_9ACTN|nr:hypothetical protein [Gordonia tangerina]MCF3939919.1 hypothetical protein [Gordonia tangerina]